MRLSIAVLGTEVFAIDLSRPTATEEPHPELTATNRHSGDFGFAGGPARPYWTSEPGEAPAVANTER